MKDPLAKYKRKIPRTIEERFILGCGRCRSDNVMRIQIGVHCFKCGYIGDAFESTYLIGGNDE